MKENLDEMNGLYIANETLPRNPLFHRPCIGQQKHLKEQKRKYLNIAEYTQSLLMSVGL